MMPECPIWGVATGFPQSRAVVDPLPVVAVVRECSPRAPGWLRKSARHLIFTIEKRLALCAGMIWFVQVATTAERVELFL